MDFELAIFDLDGVLTTADVEFVKSVLRSWKRKGIKIALASHNGRAPLYLRDLGIRHYFNNIVHFYPAKLQSCFSRNKAHLVATVLTYYPEISLDKVIFFDDMFGNCHFVSRMGIRTCNVNPRYGFDVDCLRWAVMGAKVPQRSITSRKGDEEDDDDDDDDEVLFYIVRNTSRDINTQISQISQIRQAVEDILTISDCPPLIMNL